MPAREAPQPPYVLLFREAAPGAAPLMVSVDDRPALPLFDSNEKARDFLEAADFGPDWKPVEVSGAGLLTVLETSCRGSVQYVALNPPPATGGGMRVEMGGLEELIEALNTSPEDDLFGIGGLNRN